VGDNSYCFFGQKNPREGFPTARSNPSSITVSLSNPSAITVSFSNTSSITTPKTIQAGELSFVYLLPFDLFFILFDVHLYFSYICSVIIVKICVLLETKKKKRKKKRKERERER
jgi:hypothetical protein